MRPYADKLGGLELAGLLWLPAGFRHGPIDSACSQFSVFVGVQAAHSLVQGVDDGGAVLGEQVPVNVLKTPGSLRFISNCTSGVKTLNQPVPWERFLRTSGNPLIPTPGEAVERVLSPQEAADLSGYLRPLVQSGAGQERRALAYLTVVTE